VGFEAVLCAMWRRVLRAVGCGVWVRGLRGERGGSVEDVWRCDSGVGCRKARGMAWIVVDGSDGTGCCVRGGS